MVYIVKNYEERLMEFPERLAKIRRERKLSFPELAQMIDIHPTQLRRYEKGESQPTLEVLKKLAVALNAIPVNEIFMPLLV